MFACGVRVRLRDICLLKIANATAVVQKIK